MEKFPIVKSDTNEVATVSASLDYQEANALRYSAGYVIRALKSKLERSASPAKKELILCLGEMIENEGNFKTDM